MNAPGLDRAALVHEIHRVLDEIQDPCSVSMSLSMGLGEMGLIEDVNVTSTGRVEIILRLTSPFCEFVPFMQGEALRKVRELEGVSEVVVTHDDGLNWDDDLMAPEAQKRRQRRLEAMHRLTEEHKAGSPSVSDPSRVRAT
ncbi:hypothetical protein CBI38_32845 (plasmid) [Rhodococcus oxybenzonivorans]|uniref:MIP18 family-like domain-containing protein n=1 Tax=Rhodococcus oxybenzonivorans TaxID=1990687 RepID=A0A2S2C5Y6_9NOCA|nr:iron-sulfur cluster assembly protein [Rhodococcus oxybenzonivorans]AWK76259.1 hypothetical protein CBI38_32845 [Rhodococcus oxybenzonivorans]